MVPSSDSGKCDTRMAPGQAGLCGLRLPDGSWVFWERDSQRISVAADHRPLHPALVWRQSCPMDSLHDVLSGSPALRLPVRASARQLRAGETSADPARILLVALPVVAADWPPGFLDADGGWLACRGLLMLLSISVGITFVLISASGPLLQHWFSGVYRGESLFRLYALSNLGSLVALLSYPILIEPQFTIDNQATTWSFL